LKIRIYLDTSVIGGCYDDEFAFWSKKLFAEIHQGQKIAVVSDLTLDEIEKAPQEVKNLLSSFKENEIEYVSLNDEAQQLAQSYLKHKAVSDKHLADAQHIAIATVERVDILVSWNFKQIVNVNRIHLYNAVNLMLGYPMLEIRSPREVLNEKEI